MWVRDEDCQQSMPRGQSCLCVCGLALYTKLPVVVVATVWHIATSPWKRTGIAILNRANAMHYSSSHGIAREDTHM